MTTTSLSRLAAPLCARLHAEAFAAHEVWDEPFFAKLLALPTTRGLLVEQDDTPAGFIMWQHGPEWGEILTLAVLPAYRRSGLARRLLQVMEQALLEDGITRSMLDVAADNDAAATLYKAAGYHLLSTRAGYYSRGAGQAVDALVMEKSLTAVA